MSSGNNGWKSINGRGNDKSKRAGGSHVKKYPQESDNQYSRFNQGSSFYNQQTVAELFEAKSYDSKVKSGLDQPTEGDPVELLANFFNLCLNPDIVFYHYNISAILENPRNIRNAEKFIRYNMSKIIAQYRRQNHDILIENEYFYDGHKNIYTVKKLPLEDYGGDGYQQIELTGSKDFTNLYHVTLKFVKEMSANPFLNYQGEIPADLITIYQVLINFNMAKIFESKEKAGDNCFHDPSERKTLNKIVEIVRTYECVVSLAQFGPALNIAVKTKPFIIKNVSLLEFLNFFGFRNLKNENLNIIQLNKISSLVNNLKIFTNHTGSVRSYIVKNLIDKWPSQQPLSSNGKDENPPQNSNVAEYFQKCYNIKLQNYSLILTSSGVHIPLELAFLHEQYLLNEKYDHQLKSDIVKAGQINPREYFAECQKVAKKLATQLQKVPKFNVKLETDLIKLTSKCLKVNKVPKSNEKGRADALLFLLVSKNSSKNSSNNSTDIFFEKFAQDLQQVALRGGMKINLVTKRIQKIDSPEAIEPVYKDIEKFKKDNFKIDIAFFGLDDECQKHYNELKYMCHCVFGVVSQMFVIDKLFDEHKRPAILRNLVIKSKGKIGMKAQMTNPECLDDLGFVRDKTILLGVDVIHSSEKLGSQVDNVQCSIATLVGSYEADFYKYSSSVRIQERNRNETVDKIGEMLEEVLQCYHDENKYFPKSIILFRDGVSKEQMMNAVSDIELKAISEIAAKLTGQSTKITAIVVPKRHSSRFLVHRGYGNVSAGTAVFSSVVEPHKKMFYLNAHYSKLGTSKPIKFYIIRDDHHFSSNSLYKLCLYTCYNCVRASDVISVPVPIKYADQCAYHAKMLLLTSIKKEKNRSIQMQRLFMIILTRNCP